MKFEYDLVVVGSTNEAVYAARKAAKLKARVALVSGSSITENRPIDDIYCAAYHRLTSFREKAKEYPFCWKQEIQDITQEYRLWIQEIATNLAVDRMPAVLNALGIDTIYGQCNFFRLPYSGIEVDARKLKARSYLLATGSREYIPQIAGLERVNYLSYSQLWQCDLASLPKSITIVGDGEKSLKIAQILNRLSKHIVLVTEKKTLLPSEDEELTNLLQANLEAEGIKIYTSTEIEQIKSIEAKKWLQVGNKAIAIDELIVIGRPSPNIEELNLEGIGVECDRQRIKVNRKLQTSNPKIYAVGDILGGYNDVHLARYEVDIALKNALASFNLSPEKTRYNLTPSIIHIEPNLARVGMTETQARQNFGDNIQVIRQHLPKSIAEQIDDRSPTFCKLILDSRERLLGAHLLGDRAIELIESLALTIDHKITPQSLKFLPQL
jgi:pyruvate/2-oxoglutarate dehydrogenase complex dihydrolipoamide dehydrogenase (E3) component